MSDPLDILTMMFPAPCLLPAQKRTLWTMPSMVRPALSEKRWGAGDLLIGLMPIMHRPCYYLVWIDAKWFDGKWETDEFREKLNDIWFSLENEFGCRDSEDTGRYHWPEVDDEGGCCWFLAGPNDVLTPRQRKRYIPEFDSRSDVALASSPPGGQEMES